MKIVVTGSSGFFGSLLSATLSRKHQVVKWRRPGSDTCDSSELAAGLAGADAVVHCAGLKGGDCAADVREAVNANVLLTDLLARASKAAGVRRFFYVSSGFVYGRQPRLPCPESAEPAPADVYAMTKLLGELTVRRSGVPFTIARFSTLFGFDAGGRGCEAVCKMTDTAFSRGEILIFGDGGDLVDPLSARDACHAVEALLEVEQAEGQVVNVGGGRRLTVGELAAIVSSAVQSAGGPRPVVRLREAPPAIPRFLETARLRELIGTFPLSPLEDATARYAADYRDHKRSLVS